MLLNVYEKFVFALKGNAKTHQNKKIGCKKGKSDEQIKCFRFVAIYGK